MSYAPRRSAARGRAALLLASVAPAFALALAFAPAPGWAKRPPGPSPMEVARAIDARAADYAACRSRDPAKRADLAGTLTLRVTLDADGGVESAIVESSTLPGAKEVESCIVAVVAKLRFSAPYVRGWSTTRAIVLAPPGTKPHVATYGDDGRPVGDGEPVEGTGGGAGGGGLGLRGTGGSGGTGEGTIGLGSIGTGPGEGYGISIGRPASGPTSVVKLGTPVVRGALDKEIVRRIVRRFTAQLRYCYDKELVRAPGLAGALTLRFVIGADGKVTSASAGPSPIGSPALEACVAARARTWLFPTPESGGVVDVTFPMTFDPGARAPLAGAPGPKPKPPKPPKPVLPETEGCLLGSTVDGRGAPLTEISFPPGAADVREPLCAKLEPLRACWIVEDAVKPGPSGKSELTFSVAAGGAVVKSKVKSSTHGRPALDACFLRVLRTASFPDLAAKAERKVTIRVAPPSAPRP